MAWGGRVHLSEGITPKINAEITNAVLSTTFLHQNTPIDKNIRFGEVQLLRDSRLFSAHFLDPDTPLHATLQSLSSRYYGWIKHGRLSARQSRIVKIGHRWQILFVVVN